MAGTEVIYFPFGLQLPGRQDSLNYFPPEPVANSPPLAIRLPTVLSLRIRAGLKADFAEATANSFGSEPCG